MKDIKKKLKVIKKNVEGRWAFLTGWNRPLDGYKNEWAGKYLKRAAAFATYLNF